MCVSTEILAVYWNTVFTFNFTKHLYLLLEQNRFCCFPHALYCWNIKAACNFESTVKRKWREDKHCVAVMWAFVAHKQCDQSTSSWRQWSQNTNPYFFKPWLFNRYWGLRFNCLLSFSFVCLALVKLFALMYGTLVFEVLLDYKERHFEVGYQPACRS